MNVYGMRAELGDEGGVKMWHMTKDGALTALCNRDLDPAAPVDHDSAWAHTKQPLCHTCGALYLRQVPYESMISG
ncbi:hypothetical protein [Streptacidiphilus anmyonensis]|uniref:hypothetical protein n=1 Tax=Streptacidiphilus anmyonensis TaxID=405782 RepID=UPI0005AA87EC|nr:hypothetical protein [Streptacidiphilus anmyonensis]